MMVRRQPTTGVSPVIGILLMVAVTIGLFALGSIIFLDIGNQTSEPADASVDLTEAEDDSDVGVSARIEYNDNVDEFFIEHEHGETKSFDEVGVSNQMIEGPGQYMLIANVDGSEQQLDTVTIAAEGSGEFQIQAINGHEGQIDEGDTYSIDVDIRNDANEIGTQEIELEVEDQGGQAQEQDNPVDVKEVTVEEDEVRTYELEWDTGSGDSPGGPGQSAHYEIYVHTEDDTESAGPISVSG